VWFDKSYSSGSGLGSFDGVFDTMPIMGLLTQGRTKGLYLKWYKGICSPNYHALYRKGTGHQVRKVTNGVNI